MTGPVWPRTYSHCQITLLNNYPKHASPAPCISPCRCSMKALTHCPSHTSLLAFCLILIFLQVTQQKASASNKCPFHCNFLLLLFGPSGAVIFSVHLGWSKPRCSWGNLCYTVQSLECPNFEDSFIANSSSRRLLKTAPRAVGPMPGTVANTQAPTRETAAAATGDSLH